MFAETELRIAGPTIDLSSRSLLVFRQEVDMRNRNQTPGALVDRRILLQGIAVLGAGTLTGLGACSPADTSGPEAHTPPPEAPSTKDARRSGGFPEPHYVETQRHPYGGL